MVDTLVRPLGWRVRLGSTKHRRWRCLSQWSTWKTPYGMYSHPPRRRHFPPPKTLGAPPHQKCYRPCLFVQTATSQAVGLLMETVALTTIAHEIYARKKLRPSCGVWAVTWAACSLMQSIDYMQHYSGALTGQWQRTGCGGVAAAHMYTIYTVHIHIYVYVMHSRPAHTLMPAPSRPTSSCPDSCLDSEPKL